MITQVAGEQGQIFADFYSADTTGANRKSAIGNRQFLKVDHQTKA